jgi:DNA-binding MarR family transcriptional regulator
VVASQVPGVGARLHAALDAMEAGITETLHDLGLTQYRARFSGIVRVLARNGPQSIGELAAATGVTHSAASQTVNELRVRGLVHLRRGEDERRRIVSLADEVRPLLPAIEAEWAATESAMAGLDAELSVPLGILVAQLEAALQKRSFRQRIGDAATTLEGTVAARYRAALVGPVATSEGTNRE